MASTIKAGIQEDMKQAMRSQDKTKLMTIRLILSAIKQREVDDRVELTDDDVLAILNKMVKQRRDSLKQFETGGRQDLADKEAVEIEIIQTYLPEQLGDADLDKLIDAAIKASGAASAKDMGKVMAILKSEVQGRADFTSVSQKVKEKLA